MTGRTPLAALRALRLERAEYRREAAAFAERYGKLPRDELARSFLPWMVTNRYGRTPLEDGLPWLTIAATRFLRACVREGMHVWEYGCGGSTRFLLERGACVWSVEHDDQWLRAVEDALDATARSRWVGAFVPPETRGDGRRPAVDAPDGYASSDPAVLGLSFESYVRAIEREPDESFDAVIVDGRARPSCLLAAVPKLRPGGWLLLDNAERPNYARAQAEVAALGFSSSALDGPGLYNRYFWRSTAWQRPHR